MHIYIITGAFILFDIITGIIKALANEGLNSTNLRQGLFHKLSEVLAVVGSGLLEYGAEYVSVGDEIPFLTIVSSYICVMELISILENLCIINPKLAKLLKPYLEKLKDGEDDEKGD